MATSVMDIRLSYPGHGGCWAATSLTGPSSEPLWSCEYDRTSDFGESTFDHRPRWGRSPGKMGGGPAGPGPFAGFSTAELGSLGVQPNEPIGR